jgi:hypothetical protein
VIYEGQAITGLTPCNTYAYYGFQTNSMCKDVLIDLYILQGEANLYVSKTTATPTLEDQTWTSYNWGDDHLVIASTDPAFAAGYFYIGVHTYCGPDVPTGDLNARFILNVTRRTSELDGQSALPLGANSLTTFIPANDPLQSFHFCVDDPCADIIIRGSTAGDEGYVDVIISESVPNPGFEDYSLFHNASSSDTLNITGRNYRRGNTFISLLGVCTNSSSECLDGWNVTLDIEVHPRASVSFCTSPASIIPLPSPAVPLMGGLTVTVSDQAGGSWKFFSFNVTNDCDNAVVVVKESTPEDEIYGDPTQCLVTIAPILPALDAISWGPVSFLHPAEYNISLSVEDNEYPGSGMYYVGCLINTAMTSASYEISIVIEPTNDLYGQLLGQQNVPAESYISYHFCVPSSQNVVVDLINMIDNIAFPQNYSWPELLVASNPRPTLSSYSYKLAQIERRHVTLRNAPKGRFFISVYGWCTPAEFCYDYYYNYNPDECGPCSHYSNNSSPFSLHVFQESAEVSQSPKPKPNNEEESRDDIALALGASIGITAAIVALGFGFKWHLSRNNGRKLNDQELH